MKTFFHANNRRSEILRREALTMVEMMVTMAIFGLVVIGMVGMHIFGLRERELVGSKLGASDQSRIAFNDLVKDIRSARTFDIGSATINSFTPVGSGALLQGSAIKIFQSADTNSFIIYYYDDTSPDRELHRRVNGSADSSVIARFLTNSIDPMIFRAENYQGTNLPAGSKDYVVHVLLQFYQYQNTMAVAGVGTYFDYYKIEFKLTPRISPAL